MKLPAVQKAIVPRAKITDYLLCLTHTNGQSKAKFFLNQGFCIAYWQELAEALKHLALRNEVNNVENTPFGMRYVIDGKITFAFHFPRKIRLKKYGVCALHYETKQENKDETERCKSLVRLHEGPDIAERILEITVPKPIIAHEYYLFYEPMDDT